LIGIMIAITIRKSLIDFKCGNCQDKTALPFDLTCCTLDFAEFRDWLLPVVVQHHVIGSGWRKFYLIGVFRKDVPDWGVFASDS